MDRKCPGCGGPVDYMLTCHTYSQRVDDNGTERWMSCMPCDSAYYWYCDGTEENDWDGCGWRWTEGLNPRNPRAAENEENNPHWEE